MASAAKHVLNDPATLVVDSLKGLAILNPEIKLDEASRGKAFLVTAESRISLTTANVQLSTDPMTLESPYSQVVDQDTSPLTPALSAKDYSMLPSAETSLPRPMSLKSDVVSIWSPRIKGP